MAAACRLPKGKSTSAGCGRAGGRLRGTYSGIRPYACQGLNLHMRMPTAANGLLHREEGGAHPWQQLAGCQKEKARPLYHPSEPTFVPSSTHPSGVQKEPVLRRDMLSEQLF